MATTRYKWCKDKPQSHGSRSQKLHLPGDFSTKTSFVFCNLLVFQSTLETILKHTNSKIDHYKAIVNSNPVAATYTKINNKLDINFIGFIVFNGRTKEQKYSHSRIVIT